MGPEAIKENLSIKLKPASSAPETSEDFLWWVPSQGTDSGVDSVLTLELQPILNYAFGRSFPEIPLHGSSWII